MPQEQPVIVHDMTISVLGYREDESWCALGLEVDLLGHGKTFDEACKDLADLILMQIGFAEYKNQPEMIWHPADPIYFHRFAEQRNHQLHSLAHGPSRFVATSEYHAGGVSLPSHHLISETKKHFALSDA